MAEYKNWYLAGGSGMKDERKKLKLEIHNFTGVYRTS